MVSRKMLMILGVFAVLAIGIGCRAYGTPADSVHSASFLLRTTDCSNIPRNNPSRFCSTNTHRGWGLWRYDR